MSKTPVLNALATTSGVAGRVIRDAAIVDDAWFLVRPAANEDLASLSLPDGPVILPWAVFDAQRDRLQARIAAGEVGVWLAPDQDPALLVADLPRLPLVAIDFPVFRDGRGYSSASLLRTRHGFAGELRAIGDVLRDQLFQMRRCGFNSYALRPDRSMEDALAAFRDFSDVYQYAADGRIPAYRRARVVGAQASAAASTVVSVVSDDTAA